MSAARNAMRRAAEKHAAAVHATTGERLRWMPQAPPGDATAGGPDPDRPEKDIVATVTRRPQVVEREGAGANSAANVQLASAAFRVSYPAALRLDLRPGDLVQRLDEAGTPVLRLSTALPINGRVIHPADVVP